jgi:hypothetical protein
MLLSRLVRVFSLRAREVSRGARLAALVLGLLALPRSAAAQASSWLYVGGGAGRVERADTESLSLVQVDAGLGTSSRRPIVVGGLFRLQGYLGGGADLGVVARLCNSSFVQGGFGVGLDAGVYQRWWGPDSTGLAGNLVLGAPWGITLVGGATLGTDDQRVYFASLGIDFARLTVHRHTGLDWFGNPMRSPDEER